MKILLLRNDFYKIDVFYKQSSGNSKHEFATNLLKMIIRVTKMRESKTQVSKLVGIIWNRICKIIELKNLLSSEQIDKE